MCGLNLHEQIEALMDIEAYEEVVRRLDGEGELDPSDFLLNWELGWAYYKLDQFEPALRPLQRAVELEPSEFAGRFSLGVTLEAMGRLNEAELSLRQALLLRDSDVARQALAVVLMEKGKAEAAEQVHLDGLAARPESAGRWEGYADFLIDTGRVDEAEAARAEAAKFASQIDDAQVDE